VLLRRGLDPWGLHRNAGVVCRVAFIADSSASSSAGSTPRDQGAAGEPGPFDLPGDSGVGEHDEDAAAGTAWRSAAALLQAAAAPPPLLATTAPQGQQRCTRQDRRILPAALQHQHQEGNAAVSWKLLCPRPE